MNGHGPIDTTPSQVQSAVPSDLQTRVQLTQMQAQIVALEQSLRDRGATAGGGGGAQAATDGTGVAMLDVVREIRDLVQGIGSQLAGIEEAIRTQ